MTRPPDLKDIDEQIEKLNVEKESGGDGAGLREGPHLRDRAEKLKKEKDKLTKDWRRQGQGDRRHRR